MYVFTKILFQITPLLLTSVRIYQHDCNSEQFTFHKQL